jgi:hypothetical protein
MEAGLNINIHRKLTAAFETGLRQKYPTPLGTLLADAVGFNPRGKLDPNKLRASLSDEAVATVAGIVANRADAPLMLMIRSQMIGHAVLYDRDGVIRWATEGLTRCVRVAGPWTAMAMGD